MLCTVIAEQGTDAMMGCVNKDMGGQVDQYIHDFRYNVVAFFSVCSSETNPSIHVLL